MAVLTAEEIADLVVSTQRDLGPMKFTDLTSDLQEHVAMSRLMKRERVGFSSGIAIQWNVLLRGDSNARNSGLFEVDNVNQEDGLAVATVPWRHSYTAYAFDRRQLSMNRSPSKIIDFVKVKRYQSAVSLIELMEKNFWGEPNDSADELSPYGVKYWLVYNSTEGFNGGNNPKFPSGPGGLNRNTCPRWKNYTFQYTNVTKTDLVRKLRRAMEMCRYKPVRFNVDVPDYNTGDRYGIYTTYDILSALEELAESQNDNLDDDLASKDGRVMLRRTHVEWVPYLQENDAAAAPVVGINWGVFKPIFLEGEYLREDPPQRAPNQHNVLQAFTDITYNFVCYECRKLFLGAKSTWH